MKNLVLIGLTGCGKTTFGIRLARRLHLPLLDTDAMITAAAGREIADIFATEGEAFFRDIENAACLAVAEAEGAVIATGGGAVLREENMEALARNGVIIFIDRHPSRILRSTGLADRPLVAGDLPKIYRLYAERLPLYRRYAHAIVRNDSGRRSMRACLHRILRLYRELS